MKSVAHIDSLVEEDIVEFLPPAPPWVPVYTEDDSSIVYTNDSSNPYSDGVDITI